MIWSALGKAIYWTIGAVQAAGEAVAAGRKLVRNARRGILPSVDDTQPLSYKDVEHQREQMRSSARKW